MEAVKHNVNYQISVDFLQSLAHLDKTTQKQTREAIDDIVKGGIAAGLRLHKINHPSKAVASYSVNRDVRVIVHQHEGTTTLLYVDHHDDAYAWLNRRSFISLSGLMRIIVAAESTDDEVVKNPIARSLSRSQSLSDIELLDGYRTDLLSLENDDEVLNYICGLGACP